MESEIESAQFLAEPGDEVQLQVARHEQRGESDLWKVRRVIDRHIQGFPAAVVRTTREMPGCTWASRQYGPSSLPPVLTFIRSPGYSARPPAPPSCSTRPPAEVRRIMLISSSVSGCAPGAG